MYIAPLLLVNPFLFVLICIVYYIVTNKNHYAKRIIYNTKRFIYECSYISIGEKMRLLSIIRNKLGYANSEEELVNIARLNDTIRKLHKENIELIY